jgi:hypothetical protein
MQPRNATLNKPLKKVTERAAKEAGEKVEKGGPHSSQRMQPRVCYSTN